MIGKVKSGLKLLSVSLEYASRVIGYSGVNEKIISLSLFLVQCHSRVMFKQFLQASALQFVQIDSCRVGSVNENLAVLLMAHKFQGKIKIIHSG